MNTSDVLKSPVIILIEPQMGENIGACARAMLNCGVTEMRLVRPRDGWPSLVAESNAVGAFDHMPPVQVFDTTEEAVADCHYLYATTARPRDMVKPVFTAKGAAEDIKKREAGGQKTGILFGPERAGLSNEDIACSHAIVTVPLNPDFSSLNLAQGVLLLAYEWFQLDTDTPAFAPTSEQEQPAPQGELINLCNRLEEELEKHHFFRSPPMKPTIVRNFRNMLSRAEMTDQEIQTFHGMISALIGKKAPPEDK